MNSLPSRRGLFRILGGLLALPAAKELTAAAVASDSCTQATNEIQPGNSRPLTSLECSGQRTTFTYYSIENRVTLPDPSTRVATYTFDYSGRLKSMTDPSGRVTKFTEEPTERA